MYLKFGCTQTARLDGSVHGVVVQASRDVFLSLTRGKAMVTTRRVCDQCFSDV